MSEPSEITQELCNHLFTYDDGVLYWKNYPYDKKHPRVVIGDPAGCWMGNGYHYVSVHGRRCKTQRIIFLMHHGHLPPIVDHIDCDPKNNRIENLRASDAYQNRWNSSLSARNSSGAKGVSYCKRDNKWAVRVEAHGVVHCIARITDKKEAMLVAKNVRKLLHKEFARCV